MAATGSLRPVVTPDIEPTRSSSRARPSVTLVARGSRSVLHDQRAERCTTEPTHTTLWRRGRRPSDHHDTPPAHSANTVWRNTRSARPRRAFITSTGDLVAVAAADARLTEVEAGAARESAGPAAVDQVGGRNAGRGRRSIPARPRAAERARGARTPRVRRSRRGPRRSPSFGGCTGPRQCADRRWVPRRATRAA